MTSAVRYGQVRGGSGDNGLRLPVALGRLELAAPAGRYQTIISAISGDGGAKLDPKSLRLESYRAERILILESYIIQGRGDRNEIAPDHVT
jgi:hypothetical protein